MLEHQAAWKVMSHTVVAIFQIQDNVAANLSDFDVFLLHLTVQPSFFLLSTIRDSMPGLLCSAAVAVSGADWASKEQMGPVGVSNESSLLFKNADGMEKLSQSSLLVICTPQSVLPSAHCSQGLS
jgi:hypothetical protein